MWNIRTASFTAVVSLSLAGAAFAESGGYSIGLNFGANENSGGSVAVLGATDVAGVPRVKQANWNNLYNNTGSQTNNIVGDTNGVSVPSSVTVTWTGSGNTWESTGRGEENNGGFTGPDHTLMTGYLDTGGSTTTMVTVSNLPPDLTGPGYNVYVYFLGGVDSGRGGGYFVADAATQQPLTPVVLATCDQNPTTYNQVTTNFDAAGATYGVGNYIVFTGLKSANIIVEASTDDPLNTGTPLGTGGTPRAPLNAVQLVAANQAPLPSFGNVVATPRSLSQTIDDFPPVVVATNTIAVQLDGTNITVAMTKPVAQTVISYDVFTATQQFFVPKSTHTLQVSLKDTTGKSYTNVAVFQIPNYALIPPSFALDPTTVDTNKPGFLVRAAQVQLDRNDNSNARSDQMLFGELGPSFADPTSFTDNGYFDETSVINYPSGSVPGIDSAGHTGAPNPPNAATDDIALDFTTVLYIPAAGVYQFGVNSDDGFRTYVGTNLLDRFQEGAIMAGEFDGGRGRADTVYTLAVQNPGYYPFRLTYENGTGGYGLNWFSVMPDGTQVDINNSASPIKAYRKAAQGRAYIKSVVPGVGPEVYNPTGGVQIVVVDAATKYVSGSATMKFDGADVTSSLSVADSGTNHTVSYNSGPLGFLSTHSVVFSYGETGSPTNTVRTVNFAFTVRTATPGDLPASSFWIESEDWDISGGQTIAAASAMPYGGGSYQSSGTDTTKMDIDYHNDDGKDSQTYRSGGDLDVADANGNFTENVDTTDNAGGQFGTLRPGGFVMSDDWRIGWINGGDWGNYTRTLPTNVYNVYAAMSWGGDPLGVADREFGSLDLVTSGWGTKSQTTQRLGSFDAPSSGNWGDNFLMKMKAPDGSDAVVKLGGTNTLRFNADQGDFDWFVLTPTVSPPKVAAATPVTSVHGWPRNTPIDITIANLSTSVNTNTVKLNVNGTDVTSSAVISVSAPVGGNGSLVTVHDQPPQLLPVGSNSYTLTFSDTGSPAKQISFTSAFVVDPRATPGQFLIEAEDFDFGGGQTTNTASTMPYLGGVYNGLSAKFGVDYVDHENQESDQYRTGGDLDVKGQGANMDPGPGDFNRGSWTNTVNHKIGWIGSDDWYNYTRTFPANDYQVWVALSHGNAAGELHDLKGTIAWVTAGTGTTNQTVQVLGSCDAPSTGSWGLNNLVPMTDTNGVPIVVHLSGAATVQYQGNSGDYDYLLFVPGKAAPAGPKFSAIKVSGTNLIITWDGGGTLQQATSPSGTWSPVTGSPTSPATVSIGTNKTLFFRVQQ